MLMNPKLQGLLPDVPEQTPSMTSPPERTVSSAFTTLRRTRLLMTLLPVPVYCAVEALVGIENVSALWALMLTPIAMLWYAMEYFLHNRLVRLVLKEVAHYGLYLTPAVTLFVAGLQPPGDGWPVAKAMLVWGELACCSTLALVLWRDRQESN
jgi:hypothetical protein